MALNISSRPSENFSLHLRGKWGDWGGRSEDRFLLADMTDAMVIDLRGKVDSHLWRRLCMMGDKFELFVHLNLSSIRPTYIESDEPLKQSNVSRSTYRCLYEVHQLLSVIVRLVLLHLFCESFSDVHFHLERHFKQRWAVLANSNNFKQQSVGYTCRVFYILILN